MNNRIILTGATGNTGQVIADQCRRSSVPFVAMARSQARQNELQAAGIETVYGDFDDSASLEQALEGADKAYLVCTPDEHLIRRETAFIEAAKKVGVSCIVKCSAYLADENGESQNLRSHAVIEHYLINSGLEYTIIRPIGYMQTFTLFNWEMIQKAGALSMPAGDGGMPIVDVRDVAKVAVKALTEKGHTGKIYDVTGPEVLNLYQIAEILQRVLGYDVTYIPGSEMQTKQLLSLLGFSATPTEHVLATMRMQREHRFERVHDTQQQLGIEPTTYEQFLHDLLEGRTGGGNSFQLPDTLMIKLMNAVMPVMMRMQARKAKRQQSANRRS